MDIAIIPFLLAVVAGSSILLGIASALEGGRKSLSVTFGLLAISAGLWIGFTVIRFYAFRNVVVMHGPQPLDIFSLLSTMSATSIFYFFLLFTNEFYHKKFVFKNPISIFATIMYAVVCVLIFIPGQTYISQVVFNESGAFSYQPDFNVGWAYTYVFIPYLGFCFLWSLFRLLQVWRRTADPDRKRQARDVCIGVGVSGGIGIAVASFRSLFFVPEEFILATYFGVFLFVLVLAYSIFRHNLLQVRIVATEFLVFVIWAFLIVHILVERSMEGFIMDGMIFIFVVIFGFLTIKNIRAEEGRTIEINAVSRQLIEANKQLEELDVTRSRFLSFATHQVKTPMTAIKGYASLINAHLRELPKEKVVEMVDRMKVATERTIHLVDSLLDAKRIEDGKMEYRFSAVNVVSIVSSVVEDLQLMARGQGLELTMEKEDDRILISADRDKFREVVQNLVENALKYTNKGWVRARIYRDGDDVLIAISDSGMGIEKEVLPKLFSEFARGGGGASVIQGTGLGLYIARQIITDHHGTIWAESEGIGKGSTFFVRIKRLEKTIKNTS
jgi:signal transduction histidine kinase